MPTVPAAGYPTGPEAPPRISPDVPRGLGPRQEITATPEDFGAQVGHSMTALSGVLTKSAEEFAQVAMARADLHNNVVSDNAINNYNDQLTQKETAFYALHGQAMVDAYPAFRDDLIKSRNEMRQQMQNPYQQLKFDQETRRIQAYTLARAGTHYDQQYDVFQSETNQKGAALAAQTQATHFDDPVAFDQAVRDQMEAGYKELQRLGLGQTPRAIAEMQGQVRNDAITRQIEGYLGRNKPAEAKVVFDRETGPDGALINTQTVETLNNRIRSGLIQQGAREITANVMGGGAIIPYTPATGILEGTGLNQAQYDIYRRTTASEESKRYDEPPNRLGYMGRYQMGGAETAKIRGSEDFNEIAKTARRMNIPVPTTQEFLSNPKLQEQMFENYTLNNHNELMQRVEQYRNGSPQERAALLMGAHIGGVDGVIRYLSSGGKDDPSDGHRSVGDYIKIMRAAMKSGGPQVAVEPYTPIAGTAGAYTPAPPAGAAAPVAGHLGEAVDQLKLTAQEANLYQHHLQNLNGPGKVVRPNGDISTLSQAVVEHDGKFYSIPTIWDGKALSPQDAEKRAAQVGWDMWPSYGSVKEANERYADIHNFIDQDTVEYRSKAGAAVPAAAAPPGPKILAQLEADALAQANAYAVRNNFDDDMIEQLRAQALSRVRAQYNVSEQATKSAYHTDLTLARAEAIGGGPNGEPFHSLDAYLEDPERHARYDRLTPADQLSLAHRIATNPVPVTPERLARYNELRGMAISDPAAFLKIDPIKEDLPVDMQKSLGLLHDQVFKNAQVDFNTTKAMSDIERLGYLQDTGIDKKINAPLYHQFVGALSDAGNQFKIEHARPPNTEELRKIATDLLKVVIPGASWNPFSSDTRQFETIVPNADRNDIVRAYNTQFGRNPTPAQILQIYHYQLDHPSAGPNQAAAELPVE